MAPENGGFQVRNLQTSRGLFSGAKMLVSGSVKQKKYLEINYLEPETLPLK